MLRIENLKKTYFVQKPFQKPQPLQALRGVSLHLQPGKTLAIVGESGCGKSTLAKLLMHLEEKTDGKIYWQGQELSQISARELSEIIQIVFQDPNSSLNPRKTIYQSIAEPLIVKGYTQVEIQEAVQRVAEEVGLRPEWLERYPHMMSGGQKQRVGIARALITKPKVIICDEPVSALDVSVQAQVLNLLRDLQKDHGVSYLFISHDLSVVRFVAHQVAVLYFGEVVELAEKSDLFANPMHPYTQLLLQSAPHLGEKSEVSIVEGELPSPLQPPVGCAFQSRCAKVQSRCRTERPQLKEVQGRQVACHEVVP